MAVFLYFYFHVYYYIFTLQARHLCFFFDYAALSLYSLGVAIAYKAYLFPRELIGTRSVQLIIEES